MYTSVAFLTFLSQIMKCAKNYAKNNVEVQQQNIYIRYIILYVYNNYAKNKMHETLSWTFLLKLFNL